MDTPTIVDSEPTRVASDSLAALIGEAVGPAVRLAFEENKPETPAAFAAMAQELEDAAEGSLFERDAEGSIHSTDLQQLIARHETAGMEQSITSAVERPLNGIIPNVKLGSIVIGGTIGLITGELVDGFAPTENPDEIPVKNVAIKGGAMVGLAFYGTKFLSREARNSALTVLGLQVAADVLPLDDWIQKIVDKVRGVTGAATGATTSSTVGSGETDAAASQQTILHRQDVPFAPASGDPLAVAFGL